MATRTVIGSRSGKKLTITSGGSRGGTRKKKSSRSSGGSRGTTIIKSRVGGKTTTIEVPTGTISKLGPGSRITGSRRSGGPAQSGGQRTQEKKPAAGVVRRAPDPFDDGIIEGSLRVSERFIAEERQKSLRGGDQGFLGGIRSFGVGIASVGIGLVRFGKTIITDPGAVVSGLGEAGRRVITGEGFPEAGRIAKQDPSFALGAVAGEVLTTKGVGKLAGAARVGASRVLPSFKKVGKTPKGGRTLSADDFDIQIVRSIPGESLQAQVKRAGTNVNAVSAQRDLFGTFTRREIKIDKPKITPFDPEIERSFFADPAGRLRESRLFEKPPKKLRGIEAGVEFASSDAFPFRLFPKGDTPAQALLFRRAAVQKFPKSFIDIEKALSSGGTLTKAQAKRLEGFQLSPSGKFKPVGFVSKEAEVTLAPGEILRRGPRKATTIISGRRVDVFEPSIVQSSKKTQNLIRKAQSGELGFAGEAGLRRRLSRETGGLVSRKAPRKTSKRAFSKRVSSGQPQFFDPLSLSPIPSGRQRAGVGSPLITSPLRSFSPPGFSGGGSGSARVPSISRPPRTPRLSPPIKPPRSPPRKVPKPKKPKGKKPKAIKRGKTPFQQGITASLDAVLLGIESSTSIFKKGTEFTGLETRPVVRRKKRRR